VAIQQRESAAVVSGHALSPSPPVAGDQSRAADHVAVLKGTGVDLPRNLAKSITVE
jgi:hypothetical protein